jgi:hypothetical protein
MIRNLVGSFYIKITHSCLLMDQDEMSNLNRELSIDASYQVSVQLTKLFQTSTNVESKKSANQKQEPLCQMNRNLVGCIYGRSFIKIAHFIPIHTQIWLP